MTSSDRHDVDLVEIVTTVGRKEDAMRIVRHLVTNRVVACGTWGMVRSMYIWKGRVVDEREIRVELKTTSDRAAQAEAMLASIHPYETPAILRLPVVAANESYAAWVLESVDPDGPPPKVSE